MTDQEMLITLRNEPSNNEALERFIRRFIGIVEQECFESLDRPVFFDDVQVRVMLGIVRNAGMFDPQKDSAKEWIRAQAVPLDAPEIPVSLCRVSGTSRTPHFFSPYRFSWSHVAQR